MAWTGLHTFITVAVVIGVTMGIISAVRVAHWQRTPPRRRVNKGIEMPALSRMPVIQYDPEMGGELPFVARRGSVSWWRRILCLASPPTAMEEELPTQAPFPPSPSSVSLPPSSSSPLSVPLPVSPTLSDPQSCVICIEDFTRGTDVRQLPCGHMFHLPCVDPWLLRFASTCPTW